MPIMALMIEELWGSLVIRSNPCAMVESPVTVKALFRRHFVGMKRLFQRRTSLVNARSTHHPSIALKHKK
jgi:hypothetical protein